MLHYIFLLLLLISVNVFAMEVSENKLGAEQDNSLLISIPDEIKMKIFKMVARPNYPIEFDKIIKSKKDVQNLRCVCKAINEFFKDEKFQKLDNQLYKIEQVNKLNERDRQTTPDMNLIQTAVKYEIVPYIEYYLSKVNSEPGWDNLFKIIETQKYRAVLYHRYCIFYQSRWLSKPENLKKLCSKIYPDK
ncbi:hypothetical protein M1446_04320 [Candidatus Dependentiae bacterium]|nr:hypothetical protein [Candidatus Dependentiae bacterium]